MTTPRTHTHALYADGTVRPLEKDCGCLTHEGPHWLHMDAVLRGLNGPLLEMGQAVAFAQEEAARLREKFVQMERQGILRLLTPAEGGRDG